MSVAQPIAPRRAGLGDAMILIFALAFGLMLSLRPLADMAGWLAMIKPAYRTDATIWLDSLARKLGPQFLVIQGVVQLLSCFVAPLTPALIVARLLPPRPPRHDLARQPGFVASIALCATALGSVNLAATGLVTLPPLLGMTLPGATVLASWSVLVGTRSWRPEPGWIDRTGRAVGAFWLATIPWSIWVAS